MKKTEWDERGHRMKNAQYNSEIQAVFDWHRQRAAEYLHKKPEEVTKEERELQKKRDFIELYGGGEPPADVLTADAAAYYHKKPEEVTKEERMAQKTRSFMHLYEAPGEAVAAWAPIDMEEAEKRLLAFRAQYLTSS